MSPSTETKLGRRLGWDLLGLALGATTVFVTISVLSYDPADPPFPQDFPPNSVPANPCGLVGAWIAWATLAGLGAASYLVPFFLAAAAWACFRGGINRIPRRFAGAYITLVSFAALMGVIPWPYWHGPVIGPGGWIGTAVIVQAERYLAPTGIAILSASLVITGLLLATDYWVVRFVAALLKVPSRSLQRYVLQPVLHRLGLIPARRVPLRRGEMSTPAESSPTIRRPRSQPLDLSAPDPDKSSTAAGTSLAGGPAPPAAAAPAVGAGQIRIRKPRVDQRDQLRAEIESQAREHTPDHYVLPPLSLLLPGEPFCFDEHERDVRHKATILEKTFADFGYHVRVVEIQTGPVIAQFEVELEAGLRVSKIMSLADDLAIALRVPSVRIVAPIPGKNTVAIEVPNAQRQIVRLREVMEEAAAVASSMRIPVFLGKDVAGNPIVVDLTSLPHLLIAGRTGTGKSVCLNAIIMSILMCRRPDEVRMLLIDPKMVELSPYKRIPHLLHPVVTDMRKAEAILAWAVDKMEERYQLLARVGVRHLSVYNQLGEEELRQRLGPIAEEEWAQIPRRLPYIVIVADEMADLMMTAAKEVETHIIRLAQKSRAVGIHLVLATQKPTVDVITGLIKSNLPARICFEVSSRIDSRVVLDEIGAEKLLGHGDMLFLRPGTNTLIRGQGTFVADEEISRVVAAVATSAPDYLEELVELKPAGQIEPTSAGRIRDELYDIAVEIVVREGRGSVSLLQRALGIGYGRAARLIDFMAEEGIVGPYNGSQARDVLITLEDWEARKAQRATSGAAGASPSPARTGRFPLRSEQNQSRPSSPAVDDQRAGLAPFVSPSASGGGSYQEAPPPQNRQKKPNFSAGGPIPGWGPQKAQPGQGRADASLGRNGWASGEEPSPLRTKPPTIYPHDGPHWPRN